MNTLRQRAQRSYILGRHTLTRIRALPREQQTAKLQQLQQVILHERRERLEYSKNRVKRLQALEVGFNRQLQLSYGNRENQAGDEIVLKYIQSCWLKARDQYAAARREFLEERSRLEIHTTENLEDFEARALKLFDLVSQPPSICDCFTLIT